jgi:predicted nucleic acid-binding protein
MSTDSNPDLGKLPFEDSAKAHYLDASALIKILIDHAAEQDGRERLLQYFNSETSFFTTSLCFSEALGIIKVKYWGKKEITEQDYLNAFKKLLWGKINIEDVPIASHDIFKETIRLVECYKIDITDAMQIVTVMKGRFSVLTEYSATILITGDKGLANAARKEGVRVWNFIRESYPE